MFFELVQIIVGVLRLTLFVEDDPLVYTTTWQYTHGSICHRSTTKWYRFCILVPTGTGTGTAHTSAIFCQPRQQPQPHYHHQEEQRWRKQVSSPKEMRLIQAEWINGPASTLVAPANSTAVKLSHIRFEIWYHDQSYLAQVDDCRVICRSCRGPLVRLSPRLLLPPPTVLKLLPTPSLLPAPPLLFKSWWWTADCRCSSWNASEIWPWAVWIHTHVNIQIPIVGYRWNWFYLPRFMNQSYVCQSGIQCRRYGPHRACRSSSFAFFIVLDDDAPFFFLCDCF